MNKRGSVMLIVFLVVIVILIIGGIWYFQSPKQDLGPAPTGTTIGAHVIWLNYPSQPGPAPTSTLTSVEKYLTSQGFSIDQSMTGNGGLGVWFSGTIAQMESVFQAKIDKYNLHGATCYAEPGDSSAFSLNPPAQFSDVIQDIDISGNCPIGAH